MAGRSRFTRLVCILTAICFALAACNETASVEEQAPAAISPAEVELRKQAKAMRRTILEGAALGGATGAGISLVLGEDEDTGFAVGAGLGAAAGTYVAAVQRKFARRKNRLKQIQSDLDRNAVEMQAALAAMRNVAAQQKTELAAIKARAQAGEDTQSDQARETQEAEANLEQMQEVIQGASNRREEFADARKLTKRKRDKESPIDDDLAALANRIEEMKQVAADLATDV